VTHEDDLAGLGVDHSLDGATSSAYEVIVSWVAITL